MSSRNERAQLLQREIEIEREIWRREVRSSLLAWCTHLIAPFGMRPQRHHRVLVAALEKVAKGEIDRLMVFMPPRHAKSEYSSKMFPPWFLAQGWLPEKSNSGELIPPKRQAIIAASHTMALAEKFGRNVRNIVDRHGDMLGYKLAKDAQAASRWATEYGSEYMAAGVGKAIAGNPADLILIDDPVPGRAEAESETIRNSTWDWYRGDLYTRLQPGGRIILIMTRWHPDDLAGRLLEEMAGGGDQWHIINMPALADAADDPLGRPPPARRCGQSGLTKKPSSAFAA